MARLTCPAEHKKPQSKRTPSLYHFCHAPIGGETRALGTLKDRGWRSGCGGAQPDLDFFHRPDLKSGLGFPADMAKLVDAPDLGSGAARHVSSSLSIRTKTHSPPPARRLARSRPLGPRLPHLQFPSAIPFRRKAPPDFGAAGDSSSRIPIRTRFRIHPVSAPSDPVFARPDRLGDRPGRGGSISPRTGRSPNPRPKPLCPKRKGADPKRAATARRTGTGGGGEGRREREEGKTGAREKRPATVSPAGRLPCNPSNF